jgi:hypothetical protein
LTAGEPYSFILEIAGSSVPYLNAISYTSNLTSVDVESTALGSDYKKQAPIGVVFYVTVYSEAIGSFYANFQITKPQASSLVKRV